MIELTRVFGPSQNGNPGQRQMTTVEARPVVQSTRLKLAIRGAVQGVGFRPFVFRLATELGLTGWVNNSPQGVFIEIEGARNALERFLLRLEREKPPRSFIQSLEASWLTPPATKNLQSVKAKPAATKPHSCCPTWPLARIVCARSSIPRIAATTTRSRIIRTAARASASSRRCPTTAREHFDACVQNVPRVSGRIRRPRASPLSRAAECVSGLRTKTRLLA